jgi:hypothetical protein
MICHGSWLRYGNGIGKPIADLMESIHSLCYSNYVLIVRTPENTSNGVCVAIKNCWHGTGQVDFSKTTQPVFATLRCVHTKNELRDF